MAIFDRFLNPAWHKISSLRPQEIFEVSVVICLHGFLRKALCEEFVVPFEKLCDPHAPKELLNGPFSSILRETQKLWPLNTDLRERLIDEIEIGFLTCVKGKPVGNLRFEVLNDSEVIDGVGCLALAEINARLNRKRPSLLSESGYSQVPDECRTQVILSWMRLANLQAAELPSFLSEMFFEKRWKANCEGLLIGLSTALGRNDRETLFARAHQECQQFSSMGTAMLGYLASGISKKQDCLKPKTPEPEKVPEINPSEWRKEHPLCFVDPKALLGVIQYIDTRTDSWHRRFKIFPQPDSLALKYDCKNYAYCTVLALAASMEPKFWDSGVHRAMDKLFRKEEFGGEYLCLYLPTCSFLHPQYFKMFAQPEKVGAEASDLISQLAIGIDLAMRKIAWNYAQNITTTPVEKLFGATNILKQCWGTPSLCKSMSKMAMDNLNVAREELDKLKNQFLGVEPRKLHQQAIKDNKLTPFEIHEFGVKIVAEYVEKEGYSISSISSDPNIDPQIVAKKDGQLYFILVRTAGYPNKGKLDISIAEKMRAKSLAEGAWPLFASVGIANAKGKADAEMEKLVRGGGFLVSYEGLEPIVASSPKEK